VPESELTFAIDGSTLVQQPSFARPAMHALMKHPFLPLLVVVLCAAMHAGVAGDRPAAVAGQFYPGSAEELRASLQDLFAHAAPRGSADPVLAVIVPHAGYVYSGRVAASGFAQILSDRQIENIFVVGVSHHASYEGAAVYVAGDFVTPLGKVAVNREIGRTLLEHRDLFLEHNPAHAVEHALEVQLPFLQFHLKKPFRIVPVLLGTSDPGLCARVADVLRPYLKPENLFVISTDLSHYPNYQDAVATDRKTIDAVLSRSADRLLATVTENAQAGIRQLVTSMCGLGAVLVLQSMVGSDESVRYTLVQYGNSGDVPAGEQGRVVGYAAISVSKPGKESFHLRPEDRRQLLAIARTTLAEYLRTGHLPPDNGRLPDALKTPCGAFVTLKKRGALRGCIGNFSGTQELARTVQSMAVSAATEDSRFSPVSAEELAGLDIEISVLTPMRKISSPDEIELGKHGIYMRKGGRAGTFLPQVARETGWSLEEFLGHCAQDKAGIGWSGWKDAELFVYEADVFGEKEYGAGR
jgi:AmmeMemoRadiSam system protein B/AmmeMemoRadiSam system protein A